MSRLFFAMESNPLGKQRPKSKRETLIDEIKRTQDYPAPINRAIAVVYALLTYINDEEIKKEVQKNL